MRSTKTRKPFFLSQYALFYSYPSVADPDPHVFGPPGSGNSKKNLDSYYFVTLFDFLSLNDVNVPSKSNKQKKVC
jgi:hypothetical protein